MNELIYSNAMVSAVPAVADCPTLDRSDREMERKGFIIGAAIEHSPQTDDRGGFFSTMNMAQSIREHSLEGKGGFESDRRRIEAPARKELRECFVGDRFLGD